MDDATLLAAAKAVRDNAYCRYSNYFVGSALLDETGTMHVGCNVENSAYPEGTCAEANAIAAMIASGARGIQTIAVVGGRQAIETCTPCGGCRQKIAEFANAQTRILLMNEQGDVSECGIADLLPRSFRLE